MAILGSVISKEVGLRLLPGALGSNIVIRTACCTVGVALPVYSTFKAIEKKDQNEQEKWLVYWAAYGSFSLVELFSDKLLYWFPLYYHVKFAFLVWLQLPSSNGSGHLYARHLRPFLLRHQVKLDRLLNAASNEIVRFISSHQQEIQYFRALISRCAIKASQTINNANQPDDPQGLRAIEGPNQTAGGHVQDPDL